MINLLKRLDELGGGNHIRNTSSSPGGASTLMFTVSDTASPARSMHEIVKVAGPKRGELVLVPEAPESVKKSPLSPEMEQESAFTFIALHERSTGSPGIATNGVGDNESKAEGGAETVTEFAHCATFDEPAEGMVTEAVLVPIEV